MLHAQAGFVVAAVRDIVLALWTTRATSEIAVSLERACRSVISQHGHISVIHVAMRDAPLPDAPTRRTLEEVSSRMDEGHIAVAVVLAFPGFWASAVRAFIKGSLQKTEKSVR